MMMMRAEIKEKKTTGQANKRKKKTTNDVDVVPVSRHNTRDHQNFITTTTSGTTDER